ncbi:hypothetical protein [Breoghania sp. L-A4]|uniref:hypothetical protein n=1 Tax=Breoghania sp. L-A4 TaxID=2304600 RepID=UPI0013C2CA03|nr:hypothetical protein [Breoghania sp. L-A4]
MESAGEAGGMQSSGPDLGGIFNMGSAAVANTISVLQALKQASPTSGRSGEARSTV